MPKTSKKKSKSTLLVDKYEKYGQEKKLTKVDVAIKNKIPMEFINKWQSNVYAEKFPAEQTENLNVDFHKGALIRMNKISYMKYGYNYNTMDMIVVVMKIHDPVLKKSANYGTLFCEILDNITPFMRQSIKKHSYIGKTAIRYFSTLPSHISCDGEYRSQFNMYSNIYYARRTFQEVWYELDEYINRIYIRRQWSLYTSYFYPKIEQEKFNSNIEFAVKNEFLSKVLLIISWFNFMYHEHQNDTIGYINDDFRDIFLQYKEIDLSFIKDLVKKYTPKAIKDFYNILFKKSSGFVRDNYIQCGYKMIPLNFREVQEPVNIKYKPWREYFISAKASDLVANGISPSFPVILDWFYIKNSRKGLYDNVSQFERLKNSEIAKEILHILYEAQRGTYFAAEGLELIEKTGKDIKKWISSKFKKLSEKIDAPINYSLEEIIMSEVTLAFANEYVGRTFADAFTMKNKSNGYKKFLGNPFKPAGYNFFAKYIFEICYGLYCLNTKIGIIHGDLHLNNATVGSLYETEKPSSGTKNSVVYNITDVAFEFPNNTVFASIIDFSRSIINPNKHENLKDPSLPSIYRLVRDEDAFRAMEIEKMINLYLQIYPNKVNKREELVVLFKNHFDAVFRLMTCIDLFMFSTRLSRFLNSQEINNKRVNNLIDKIHRLSEEYIAGTMNHLINNPKEYSKIIIAEEYPIKTIMKKCFSEFAIKQSKKIVTDIYNYDNEFKYSLALYDLFPPEIKYMKYCDMNKKNKVIPIQKIIDIREKIRKEIEKMRLQNLEMISYIATRHKQKTV